MLKFFIRITFRRSELRMIEKSIERYFSDVENGKIFLDDYEIGMELKNIKKLKEKFRIIFGKRSIFF